MTLHIFPKSIRLHFEVCNGFLEFIRRTSQLIDVGLDDFDHLYGSLPLLEQRFGITLDLLSEMLASLGYNAALGFLDSN